jgi:hypothetical protein
MMTVVLFLYRDALSKELSVREAMVIASYGTGVTDTYEKIKQNVMQYGPSVHAVGDGSAGTASSGPGDGSSSPRVASKGPRGPCDRPGCDKVGLTFKCSLCKGRYCSELCQKSDWRAHKKLCTLRVPVPVAAAAAEEVRLVYLPA